MNPLPLRIDPLPPIPAGLPGDPITGNTGGSSGGGQAGTSLQLSYYGYDHLGNTRMVFHTVLKVDEEDPTYVPEYLADYYPYGKILREWLNCTGERYLTTQHERDIETGYDYRGARFYDSDLGRFLSVDPLAAEYAGWSGYNYVLGNPVRLVDPDGRSVKGDIYNRLGVHIGNDGKDNQKVYLLNTISNTQLTEYQALGMTTLVDDVQSTNSCTNVCFDGIEMTEIGITNDQLNLKAALATIRETEGHGIPTLYNSLYGGETFDDYNKHPNQSITKWNKTSTAAGAYQFLNSTWQEHSLKLGLSDFSPSNQDRAALYEMSLAKGAIDLIKSGNYNAGLKALSGKWTSLPGGKHEWRSNVDDIYLKNRASLLNP